LANFGKSPGGCTLRAEPFSVIYPSSWMTKAILGVFRKALQVRMQT
jgi:hypothetical protein